MNTIFRPALRTGGLLLTLATSPLQSSMADQVIGPVERARTAPVAPASALNIADSKSSIASEAALDFDETQSFTIEAWLNINQFQTSNQVLLEKEQAYRIRRPRSTNRLSFSTRDGGVWDELESNTDIPFDTWFHLAAVYDAETRTKHIYINGVLNVTQAGITRISVTQSPVIIGSLLPLTFPATDAKSAAIDTLRLWATARNRDQIIADIDRNLTVFDFDTATTDRSVPGLLGEWRFEDITGGVVRDSSGNGRNANSNTIDAADLLNGHSFRPPPPLATVDHSALSFPGSPGAQITVADSTSLDITNKITLEAWIQVGALDKPWQAIVTKGESWGITRFQESARLAFRTTSGGVPDDLVGSTALVAGRWYHLAATWDGIDKRLYLDGLLDAKAAWSGPLDVGADDLAIGGNAASAAREFNGMIDDVRVWALDRTAGQINAGRWNGLRGFENGLRGAWSFDEADGATTADSSYVGGSGLLGGGITRVAGLAQTPVSAPVANVPPPLGGALYFPSDLAMKSSVILPPDERLNATEAVTVEAWISISSFADKPQGIITKGQSWGLILDATGNTLNFQTRRGSLISNLRSSAALEFDLWYHVAAVFDGSKKHLYINGALDSSADFVGTLQANPLERVVFSGNADTRAGQMGFHGRMDTVRVWSEARTPDEVLAEMTRELRGTEPELVGAWRFDDNAAQMDSSWHRLHGVLAGMPAQYVPMTISGLPYDPPADGPLAIDFNRDSGDADAINLSSSPLFDFGSQMTAETWVFIPAVPAPGESFSLISKGDSAWEVRLQDNGKINFHTGGVTLNDTLNEDNLPKPGSPFPDLLSVARIEPGTWYHVAVVWDGSGETKRKEIHINGLLDNSRDDLEGAISLTSLPVMLGGQPLNDAGSLVANRFVGMLDEVRLWNIPMTGFQIRQAFDNQLHGSELGLVGYWPFSQGGREPDDSESMVALDQALAPRTPITGTFSTSMGILNRVPGVEVGPPNEMQYALSFNGTDEFIEVPANAAFEATDGNLTIEAWINPEGSGLRTIIMQGDLGYGLAIDDQNRLRFFVDGNPINSLASTGVVTTGVWQHVAVVVNSNAGTTTFYINGLPVGGAQSANVTVRPGQPLIIGKLGPYGSSFYQGLMDEVRVWTTARTPTEMEFFALQSLASVTLPGLAGYWQFNEGRDPSAGNRVPGSPDGALVEMDASNWTSGHFFEGGSVGQNLNLSPNPSAAGLWIGTIELNQVNEVQTAVGGASEEVTPTGDTLTMRLILHVDATGAVSLLKDVIIMSALSDPANPDSARRAVLVTDPTVIPQFSGIVERDGKMVGVRYSSIDYDFNRNELAMLGGVSAGSDIAGKITLAANHPTNPFRHKYHSQHATGFEITRQLSLSFDTSPEDPQSARPGFGTEWISGTYRETIGGLHKIPLKTAGRLQLQRINQAGNLNDR